MGLRPADRLALLLLLLLGCLAVAPALFPDRVFASVHSAVRVPLDVSMTEGARREAIEGGNLDTGDQTFQVIPERIALFSALENGHLPLWWPEAGGGVPLLGAPAAELAEPRTLLLGSWLGPIASLGPLAALCLAVLLGLSYLWLRLREHSPPAAAVGAIAFALAGSLTSSLFYQCKLDCLVLLPGGLAAVELWIRGRRALGFGLLFAVAADSALASFQQGTALSVYLVAGIGGWRLWQSREQLAQAGGSFVRSGAWLATAGALGLAVGSIHLLPVLDAISQSARTATGGAHGFTFRPAHVLSFFVPFVIGDPTSLLAAEWNPMPDLIPGLRDDLGRYIFIETCCYAGLVTIPLALAGALRGWRAAPALCVLVLCTATAAGSPLALLPGLSVGAPSRMLVGVNFALAWLAAEGLDAIVENSRARNGALAGAFLLLAVGAGAIGVRALVPPETVGTRAAEAREAAAVDDAKARGIEPTLPPANSAQKISQRWSEEAQFWLVAAAMLAWATAIATALATLQPRLAWACPIVLGGDLALFTLHVAPTRPARSFLSESPITRILKEEAGGARMARVAAADSVSLEDHLLFQATLPAALGIHDTSAYVVLPNALQVLLAGHYCPEAVFQGTFVGAFPRRALRSPVLDLLGVRIVVSRGELTEPDLRPIVAREGFHAYVRTSALGRAWIVPRMVRASSLAELAGKLGENGFDPRALAVLLDPPHDFTESLPGGGSVTTVDLGPSEVSHRIQGCGGGYLYESAPAVSGWTATLDGFPVPLIQANGAGRAVFVPPGDHEVRLRYLPASFLWGAAVAGLALAAGSAMIWRLARTREPLPA
ncbi:MAG: YfhO family protein [Planctomycetes bacterium]|nr:YfhO family protein [Planctomycetota bacterium]